MITVDCRFDQMGCQALSVGFRGLKRIPAARADGWWVLGMDANGIHPGVKDAVVKARSSSHRMCGNPLIHNSFKKSIPVTSTGRSGRRSASMRWTERRSSMALPSWRMRRWWESRWHPLRSIGTPWPARNACWVWMRRWHFDVTCQVRAENISIPSMLLFWGS